MRMLVLLLCLGGCASLPQDPAPIATSTKTVQVNVPVLIPCIQADQVRPRPPPPKLDISTLTPKQVAAALDMDYRALIDYSEWAEAVIAQCTKEGP